MTNTVTQSTTDAVDASLALLRAAFLAHATASLSKAHGVNVLYLPTPVYDSSGNNVQYYFDSAGDVVGTYQLRFTVSGVTYYAPANATALAAQSVDISSALLTNSQIADQLSARESTALVTPFATEDAAYADAVRDAILLPHSEQGHWEAHVPITVRTRTVVDSRGNVVGRYVATLQFDGVKYDIPCDTQLGGPPRRPGGPLLPTITWTGPLNGNFSLNGTTIFMHVNAGASWPTGFTLTYTGITGSLPMAYLWEYSVDQTTWTAFPNSYVSNAGTGALKLNIASSGNVVGGTHAASFLIQSPGGDGGGYLYFRVTFTNAGGSYTASTLKGDMKDKSDSCHVFTAAARAGYMTERELFDALRYRLTTQCHHFMSEIEWGGYSVFGRWMARFIKARDARADTVVRWFVHPFRQAFLYEMGRARFQLGPWLLGWLMRFVLPLVYLCNRNEARTIMRAMSAEDYIRRYRGKAREIRAKRLRDDLRPVDAEGNRPR